MTLRVGSLFAGIGGFDLGFERAGFEVAWCAEWDRAAQAVLRTRFPRATVYGDIREIDLDALTPVDVICGGFPCQDLSVAGKRAGLAGARSGLFHDAMRIVRRLNPRVLVLENVPGLLSSNRGLDFATVLREVGEGWDCAEVGWRLLDSQYFGVPQRRRRVFIVAGAAIGCAESILALAEGGGGDPPPRRTPREEAAADAARCPRAGGARWWDGGDCAASLTTRCHDQSMPDKSNFAAVVAFTGTSHAQYAEGVGTLRANGGDLGGGSETLAVAFRKSKRAQSANDDETWVDDGLANTLNGFDTGDTRTTHAVAFGIDAEMNVSEEIIGCMKRGGEGGSQYAVAFNWQNQREEVRSLGDCAATVTGPGTHQTNYIAFHPTQDPISSTDGSAHALGCGNRQGCATVAVAFTCKDYGADASEIAPTLRAMPHDGSHANGGGQVAVAVAVGGSVSHALTACSGAKEDGTGRGTPIVAQGVDLYNHTETGDVAATVTSASGGTNTSGPKVRSGMTVRRLTPTECERLQGFPDGWTQIGTDKPTADSHRYKQLGNAVTVNVAEWIARRVAAWLTK